MFRLFMGYMAVEESEKEYICDMCGLIYETYEEKEECYHSCLAEIDEKVSF